MGWMEWMDNQPTPPTQQLLKEKNDKQLQLTPTRTNQTNERRAATCCPWTPAPPNFHSLPIHQPTSNSVMARWSCHSLDKVKWCVLANDEKVCCRWVVGHSIILRVVCFCVALCLRFTFIYLDCSTNVPFVDLLFFCNFLTVPFWRLAGYLPLLLLVFLLDRQ